MPEKHTTKPFWRIKRGEAEWLAWGDWVKREKILVRWWPDAIWVPMEWPPETPEAARYVVEGFFKRDDLPNVEPWMRWGPVEIAERLRLFRERENPPENPPKTDAEIDALLARAGLKSTLRRSKWRDDQPSKPAPATPAMTPEMQQREADLADKKRALNSRKGRFTAEDLIGS